MNTKTNNQKFLHLVLLGAALPAMALATVGCKTPVQITAGYAVPGTNITATLDLTTNGATVGGNYQVGATNIGGAVTVGK